MNNIYILSVDNQNHSDSGFWKECVVVAKSIEEAIAIHPTGIIGFENWSITMQSEWCNTLQDIHARYVGKAGGHIPINSVLSKAFIRLQ